MLKKLRFFSPIPASFVIMVYMKYENDCIVGYEIIYPCHEVNVGLANICFVMGNIGLYVFTFNSIMIL